MCGRFAVAGAAEDIAAFFEADVVGEHLPPPSWNVAPTDPVSIVLDSIPKGDPEGAAVRRVEAARWGLVPAWAKDVKEGARAFNARIESAAEKPQFRNAVLKRRTIVPVTGYYEWKQLGGVKVPHFIHPPRRDGQDVPLVFAGLYEWWRDPAKRDDDPDRWVLSTTILTRDSAGAIEDIHDRMPVFIAPEYLEEWLDPRVAGSPELLDAVTAGGAEVAENLEFHEVDRAVGNVRNNSPELIEPVA